MEVSIAVTTYNHEKYIRQALESLFTQKVDFDFEVLIGEDGSDDGTAQIVKEFEARFPGRVKAFYHDRSKVIYVNGQPTAKYNYLNNLKHAQGKYIALLDGDDFWTSDDKLQKQYDFLEKNPQCSICFHAVNFVFGDKLQQGAERPPKAKRFYTLKDLIPENFIHTSSAMFRHDKTFVFPDWFYEISFGDWAQHLMYALNGNIGYIDECMSAYRVHPGGIWSAQDVIKRMKACTEVLESFNQYSTYKYDSEIKTAIQHFEYNLVLKLLDKGELNEAKKEFKRLASRPKESLSISRIEYFYVQICTRMPIINFLLSEPLKRIRKLL